MIVVRLRNQTTRKARPRLQEVVSDFHSGQPGETFCQAIPQEASGDKPCQARGQASTVDGTFVRLLCWRSDYAWHF